VLIFRKEYLPLIRLGVKTQTRRLRRPLVKPGRAYRLRVNYSSALRERILVERVFPQRLSEVTLEDAVKEGFTSVEEFASAIKSLYAGLGLDPELWVVEFRYLGDRNV